MNIGFRKHSATTAFRFRIIADERNTRIKSVQSAALCGSDVFHHCDFCRRQVVELIEEAANLDFEGGSWEPTAWFV